MDRASGADDRPLAGRTIVITRAQAQAGGMMERIAAAGGLPYAFPVIRTQFVSGARIEAVEAAFRQAESYDWVLLTSVNGVQAFLYWLQTLRVDIRRFYRAKFAAVGPKTAEALAEGGIIAELLPDQYQAEGLLDALASRLVSGQSVLLPRGDLAREILPETLIARGVHMSAVDVYETVPVVPEDPQFAERLQNGDIAAVTFTSASTVHYFMDASRMLGIDRPVEWLDGVEIACIGPLTAEAAATHGLHTTIMPEHFTVAHMLDALIEKFRKARGD